MKLNVFVLTVLAATCALPGPARGDDLTAIERSEPTLEQVREKALRHARLASRPEQSWARRARLRGLMPSLTVRATRGTGWDFDLSRASTGIERLDEGTDGDIGYEARATWDLDRLVFDDAEIRSAETAQRLHRVRLQLGAQVTALYYARRKLQIVQIYDPADDTATALMQQAEIDELTGQLDAVTDGWFSRQLAPTDD